jgi:hypothetical protein
MDVPQLKLLAGRVRALLQQSSAHIGHNQALDLVAALPGLRNWPEVVAFPDRVAACELDATSAARLAFRLKKNFALELTPRDLLSVLSPDVLGASQGTLQVWPAGPPAGVYVTTSAQAIGALLRRYEEATDGGLVYAEQAANDWDGSINLGEYGLWSPGIDRLPSGTLLVIGPIELDQQSWQDAAERLEMACLHALNSDHRVAVLFETPMPSTICEDTLVLVRCATQELSDAATGLAGVITEDGELQCRRPFAAAYPRPVSIRSNADLEVLPESTRERLRHELARHTSGFVLFGTSEIDEHPAYDYLAAGLTLTEHAGPAARIMPRHRATPSKDWLVPEAIKALPFLPSVQSAYAHGYRRMVIDPRYTKGNVLLDYEDVLFLSGTYEHEVAHIVTSLFSGLRQRDLRIVSRVVAVLGLLQATGTHGPVVASDLFLRGTLPGPVDTEYSELQAFLRANRAVRWEEEARSLLDAGRVTLDNIKKGIPRHSDAVRFLTRRRAARKAS